MRRYIVLLLITGILWAQTDFDILILKNGTTYFGEYSKIEEEIVYFKPQNAFGFQPISIKQVERLELKDRQVVVLNSKVKSLTTEEYFELSRNRKEVTRLHFYGAGCGTDRMKKFLKNIFKDFFPNAIADVKEDTYAAIFSTTKIFASTLSKNGGL